MTVLIFVYGTLKTGLPNHHLIENQTDGLCISRGSAETAEMFPLVVASRYNVPFMLYAPGKGKNVMGEVYEVDETRLKSLDNLEAHPDLYERRDIVVKDNPGSNSENNTIQAQAYFLVKYRPFLLDMPTFSSYDNAIAGKMFVVPLSRNKTDPTNKKHWWFEVNTDYEETEKNAVNQ